MKNITKKILVLAFLLLYNNANVKANPIKSFSGKELTIEFTTTKDKLFTDKTELSFNLIADLTKQELEKWKKLVLNDDNVQTIKITKSKSTKKRNVKLILKTPINRSNGKILFSTAIKADYVIVENEKILYNVFVSTYIPNY